MQQIFNCNGCSSRTQGLLYQRKSFSKKLLVAICISVIIAMCLTPTEAVPAGHKHNKQRQLSMTETKETAEVPSETLLRHKRRHQRHQPMTKDEEHMIKIIRNLKFTLNDFRENKNKVNDSEVYRNPRVKVPTTNFLEIRRYLQKYKNNRNVTSEEKFIHIAVRLYKSLFKYSEIFKALQKVNVEAQDVQFSKYQENRREFLREIVRNLNNILPVIGDGLADFKKNIDLTYPLVRKEKQLLENFKSDIASIDKAETSLIYDGSVFRGYGLTLKKWYCIVTSKADRKGKENTRCKTFESKMKNPKKNRKQKKKRRIHI